MTMQDVLTLVIQGGALVLLAYLILWGTREGGPKLFSAMEGIRVSIERNTNRLERVEEQQIIQTKVILRLVEKMPATPQLEQEVARLREELEDARKKD